MSEKSGRRPLGVTLLAWIYVAAGALLLLLPLVRYVRDVRTGVAGGGFPLLLVLEILLATALLLGPGIGMLLGRAGNWYWVSFCLLATAFAVPVFFAIRGPAMLGKLSALRAIPRGAYPVLAVAAGLLALVVWVYLFGGAAREYFRLTRLPRWRPIAVQVVLCCLLALSTGFVVRRILTRRTVARLETAGYAGTGSPQERRFMLDNLVHGTAPERVAAAWALGQAGSREALPALTEAAGSDPDTDVRVKAIGSLALLGGPGVEETLLGYLDEPDEVIRVAALEGLGAKKYAGDVERVSRLLSDDSARIRAAAADTLGRMGNREALPLLVGAAGDAEEDVRSHVASALGRLGDPAAVPKLEAMLDDGRAEVRKNAVMALGMIGDRSARPAVERLTHDHHPQVRFFAEQALSRLR